MIYSLTADDIPLLSQWIKKFLFLRTGIFWPYFPILNHSSLICKFYGLNLKDIYYLITINHIRIEF